MESLPNNLIYEYSTTNALHDIRSKYALEAPGKMDESIDLLENWIKKEQHFVKKDFPRSYLERCIINCKGSVEKAKKNMDSVCTLRSMRPELYGDYDFKNDFQKLFEVIKVVALPKYAGDYSRVVLIKSSIQHSDKGIIRDYFRFSLSFCDYWKAHDYFNDGILIMDYRDMSITDYLASIDFMEHHYVVTMCTDVYKARMKAIHILTSSKIIDMVVKLLKQVLSPKLRDRLHVHYSLEELYEAVPRDILPMEYGGKEKSLDKLQEEWIEVLSSQEHRQFMEELKHAVLDSRKKDVNTDNNDFGRTSGTFRRLEVD